MRALTRHWSRADVQSVVPVAIAMVAAFVVVGPAFRSGVVLSYDLAWSPDPRFTPYALGTAGTAPRAVPSDAFAVVLGHLLGSGLAQSFLLWAILAVAGVGAARLAVLLRPGLVLGGRVVASVAAVWNPFVLERYVVGHWTVLLAYAAVPHLLVACVAVRRGRLPVWSPAVGLAACAVGGANALVICVPVVLVVLLLPRPTQWRALGWSVLAALGASAAWALPAMTAGVVSSPAGVAAFASRSDTPLGVFGSLLSGGAFWNPATHPAERGVLLLALVAAGLAVSAQLSALIAARGQHVVAVLAPGALGLAAAWLSARDPAGLWSALVVNLPGGGIARDAQKLIAPWVAISAAGCGVLVPAALRVRRVGSVLAVVLAALPVVLLPSLAGGVLGRVSAVEVPSDLRVVSERLSSLGPTTVGLLPWSQYRRYEWNDHRVSLTLVPRMVAQRVVLDDSLPLTSGPLVGEDPVARRVDDRIAAGARPFDALAAEGVAWIIIEKQTGFAGEDDAGTVTQGSTVVHDGPNVELVELAAHGRLDAERRLWPVVVGWALTGCSWVVAAACPLWDWRTKRRNRLVA